jgi:hypothetical protein
MDATARCSIGLVGAIKLGVRVVIVLIIVEIELDELALLALALTETRPRMEYGMDVGGGPSLAASLKAADAEERFILDEFYEGDDFVFAMAMHAKSRDFDG